MCTSCGAKTYGQDQPEERAKDLDRLNKQREYRETKAIRRDNRHLN